MALYSPLLPFDVICVTEIKRGILYFRRFLLHPKQKVYSYSVDCFQCQKKCSKPELFCLSFLLDYSAKFGILLTLLAVVILWLSGICVLYIIYTCQTSNIFHPN